MNESNSPSVLIVAPTSKDKDYCFKDYASQLRGFNYPDYDILLCDNSEDKNYIKTIWKEGFNCLRVEPKGNPIEFVCESQNKLRQGFLQGGWDYMFMLETDVFVHPDTIAHMVAIAEAHKADVVSGLYNVFHGDKRTLCLQSTTFLHAAKSHKMLSPDSSFAVLDGQIKDITEMRIGNDTCVYSAGTGINLIRREVMETIEFRVEPKQNKTAFSDTYFGLDLLRHGFSQIVDQSIIAEHRTKSWKNKFIKYGIKH